MADGKAQFDYLNGRVSFDGLLVAVRDGDLEAGVQNGRPEFDELADCQLHDATKPVELVVEWNVRKLFAWNEVDVVMLINHQATFKKKQAQDLRKHGAMA